MSLDAIVFIEISILYTIHAKLWLISKDYLLKGESIEGDVLLTKISCMSKCDSIIGKTNRMDLQSSRVVTVKIKKSHKEFAIYMKSKTS